MKVHVTPTNIERSSNVVESTFSMDPTAEAFDILSSGLYSDKPRAVIRELACNAFDSHVAVGKGHIPIEICLPTHLSPLFHVRDFGTGLNDYEVRGGWFNRATGQKISDLDAALTPEEYRTLGFERTTGIYNTYFRSTKTSSDDFIGQLGLGSKSPFSYASTFDVVTIKDGTKYMYTCYKNEERKPCISLMGVDETTEENGVTVSLMIRSDDISDFITAARSVLMYFTPQPTITNHVGFAPHDLVHTVKGEDWRIRQTGYYAHMSGPYVVQGFVPYPVDINLLRNKGLTGVAEQIANTDIDLYVPIGSVTVAASRESLQYDPRTIDNLIESLKSVADHFRESFEEAFLTCKTMFEAAQLVDRLSTTGNPALQKLFRSMNGAAPFQWEGQNVNQIMAVDTSELEGITAQRYRYGPILKTRRTRSAPGVRTVQPTVNLAYEPNQKYTFEVQSNMYFVFDDRATGRAAQVREYISSLPKIDNREPHVIVVRATQKGDNVERQVKAFFDQIGVTYIDSSTLPPTTRQAAKAKARAAGGKGGTSGITKKMMPQLRSEWKYLDVGYKYGRNHWKLSEVDLEAGGFYVPVSNSRPVLPECVDTEFDDLIKYAVKLGLVAEKVALYGFNERELIQANKVSAKAHGKSKWVNYYDHVCKMFAELCKKESVLDKMVADQLWKTAPQFLNKFDGFYRAYFASNDGVLEESEFNQLLTTIKPHERAHKRAGVDMTYFQLQAMCNMVRVNTPIARFDKLNKEYTELWSKVQDKYDFLNVVQWDNVKLNSTVSHQLVQLIKLVDSN